MPSQLTAQKEPGKVLYNARCKEGNMKSTFGVTFQDMHTSRRNVGYPSKVNKIGCCRMSSRVSDDGRYCSE